jgi:hypothetical protein
VSTNSSEENKERKQIGFFELLKELGSRLKQEIFLLAFIFALIIAYVAITKTNFSISIGVTFILLYAVAVIAYFASKIKTTTKQIQEKSRETISWIIGYPHFQNPYKIMVERPSLRIVHFDIELTLTNESGKSITSYVYFKSPTQALGFVLDEPRQIWKRKYGIIPYRTEVELSLDVGEQQIINSNDKTTFVFHGCYRPLFAFKDKDLREKIVLSYKITAKSIDDSKHITYFDTGFKKIHIPFEDAVKYKEKEKESPNA